MLQTPKFVSDLGICPLLCKSLKSLKRLSVRVRAGSIVYSLCLGMLRSVLCLPIQLSRKTTWENRNDQLLFSISWTNWRQKPERPICCTICGSNWSGTKTTKTHGRSDRGAWLFKKNVCWPLSPNWPSRLLGQRTSFAQRNKKWQSAENVEIDRKRGLQFDQYVSWTGGPIQMQLKDCQQRMCEESPSSGLAKEHNSVSQSVGSMWMSTFLRLWRLFCWSVQEVLFLQRSLRLGNEKCPTDFALPMLSQPGKTKDTFLKYPNRNRKAHFRTIRSASSKNPGGPRSNLTNKTGVSSKQTEEAQCGDRSARHVLIWMVLPVFPRRPHQITDTMGCPMFFPKRPNWIELQKTLLSPLRAFVL